MSKYEIILSWSDEGDVFVADVPELHSMEGGGTPALHMWRQKQTHCQTAKGRRGGVPRPPLPPPLFPYNPSVSQAARHIVVGRLFLSPDLCYNRGSTMAAIQQRSL